MRFFRYALAVVLALATAAATAQNPSTPIDFSAKAISANSTTIGHAMLQWSAPLKVDSASIPTSYNVYRSTKQSENMADYTLIATVSVPVRYPLYSHIDSSLAKGVYFYFIKGVIGSTEGSRTPIKSVSIPTNSGGNESTFKFVTSPNQSAKAGSSYRYEARATHPDQTKSSLIRYELFSGPQGMTVNSTTGLVSWDVPANFTTAVTVKIKAFIDGTSEVIYQSWTIKPNNDGGSNTEKGCATIYGSVKDEDGNPIITGTVIAYVSKMSKDSSVNYVGMFKATIQQGMYFLRVNAGEYAIFTEGELHFGEWHLNKTSATDANKYTVACNDTLKADFVVTKRPAEVKFMFSGVVTDAATNQGIPAVVTFYRRNSNGSGDNLGDAITVKTNMNGEYEVSLSDRWSYVAMAKGISQDYLVQYFNGVSLLSQAELLTPTANRTNINFALGMRQQYNNGLNGRLLDSAGTGIKGQVIAILISGNGKENGLTKYRTVETDANGNYELRNLAPGDYVLFGIPNVRTSVPGYYKANDFAALRWSDGTRITLTETGVLSGQYNIRLMNGNGKKGIIRIGGNTKEKGGIIKTGNGVVQAAVGIPGVFIAVVDANNKVVDYTFSASNGSYSVADVGFGLVRVVADHPEFIGSTQELTLSGTSFTINNDVQLVRSVVSSVSEEAVQNLSVAPNPATDLVSLRFNGEQTTARISIVNTLGVEVSSLIADVQSGANVVNIPTASLESGAYTIRIQRGGATSAVRVVITR
ncbi:MAG: T9SS type A sorting domain-containing protein [Candidatus Kapabacteria bacterium]|nr:T9SS type A sorting domain-containing protein [Candidatus Kapabacteria bacterium]